MASESDPLATEREFFAALVAGDASALDKLLTDDFILVDVMAGGEVPKAGFLDAVRSRQVRFDAIVPAEPRLRIHDTAAVITGRTQMIGTMGATPFTISSRYTHIFIRQDNRWRLLSAQGTQIQQA